jgi:hypothetical protein
VVLKAITRNENEIILENFKKAKIILIHLYQKCFNLSGTINKRKPQLLYYFLTWLPL